MEHAQQLVARACDELDTAYVEARRTWRDVTAEHYGRRFHVAAVEAMRRYVHVARRLEDAIERAESATAE